MEMKPIYRPSFRPTKKINFNGPACICHRNISKIKLMLLSINNKKEINFCHDKIYPNEMPTRL